MKAAEAAVRISEVHIESSTVDTSALQPQVSVYSRDPVALHERQDSRQESRQIPRRISTSNSKRINVIRAHKTTFNHWPTPFSILRPANGPDAKFSRWVVLDS